MYFRKIMKKMKKMLMKMNLRIRWVCTLKGFLVVWIQGTACPQPPAIHLINPWKYFAVSDWLQSPKLILHNQLVLTIFGKCRQWPLTIWWYLFNIVSSLVSGGHFNKTLHDCVAVVFRPYNNVNNTCKSFIKLTPGNNRFSCAKFRSW